MEINKVTITGADNKVSAYLLETLLHDYPFLELGILVSKSRGGMQRYPTDHWIKSMYNTMSRVSYHLCGEYARDFLLGNNTILPRYIKPGDRVQINTSKLTVGTSEIQYTKMFDICGDYPHNQFIFPISKSNTKGIEFILRVISGKTFVRSRHKNIQFLYDSSGGRGTEIKEIQAPIKEAYTGYAGGLNPDNVWSFAQMISAYPNESAVWIDVESGIREENEFSYQKVRQFLDKVKPFVV